MIDADGIEARAGGPWQDAVEELLWLQEQEGDWKPGPSIQWFPKQWLGDDIVMMMPIPTRGYHFHLIQISWQQDTPCSLPDDDFMLRGWCQHPAGWEEVWSQVSRAWKLYKGRWWQVGLVRAYLTQMAYRAASKAGGKKSAEARARKYGTSNPRANQPEPEKAPPARTVKRTGTTLHPQGNPPSREHPSQPPGTPLHKFVNSSSASSSASASSSSSASSSAPAEDPEEKDQQAAAAAQGEVQEGDDGRRAPPPPPLDEQIRGLVEAVEREWRAAAPGGAPIERADRLALEGYAAEGVPLAVIATKIREVCARQRVRGKPVGSFAYLTKSGALEEAVEEYRDHGSTPPECGSEEHRLDDYRQLRLYQLTNGWQGSPVFGQANPRAVQRAAEELRKATTFGEVAAILKVVAKTGQTSG